MNLTFPTIPASTVVTGIAESMVSDLSGSEQTVPIPDQRSAFPGYALMLPAVLDELIRMENADGAVLLRQDGHRGDLLVELGRGGWNHWTGNRFRPFSGIDYRLSMPGQIEVDQGYQTDLPQNVSTQVPGTRFIAFTPIAARGYELGSLWVGRDYKLSAQEILVLKSMGDVLAEVMVCLTREHQKEIAPFDVIQALIRLLAAWDVPTYQHSIRLVSWARATARLLGCTENEIQTIGWGALLHDIGKLGVPKVILHKPGPLDEDEWKVIKLHPRIGAKLLEPATTLQMLKDIILDHHEKMDGSGYPSGLKGNEIPLGARILAVVDAYGAMTEERAYRSQYSHEQAVAEIRRCEGTHFDPQISEAFIAQFH